MIYLVSLNEISLLRFLALILLRKNVKVLRIAPFMLLATGVLTKIVEWAIKRGRSAYAVTLTPELQEYWDFNGRLYFQDVFKKYEPWQDRYYGFDTQRVNEDQDYGYAFKKSTCSYTFWKAIEIYILHAILENRQLGPCRIYGVLTDTIEMGRFLIGPSFARDVKPLFCPRIILYPVFALFAYLHTALWVLRRTRVTVRHSKVALIFEVMKDGREWQLLKEIADAGKCILIDRFPWVRQDKPAPEEMDATLHRRTDGLFSLYASLQATLFAAIEVLKIARRYRSAPPALFFESLSFPYKRLLVRGILNRYETQVFIGRDEYNVDHILRLIELKERGVKSIGIGNALFPCFSTIAANARYSSYDIYYLYAAPLFSQYFDRWPPDMQVRTLGGYSQPRETMVAKIGSRGENILFTMRVAWNQPEMIRMVRQVAQAFPSNTVTIQFKFGFVDEENSQRLVAECTDGLPNVQHTTEDVYTLLEQAKYHISDISSFVAEAIRSGMVTLVADVLEMEHNCYRTFPGLCSKTADELVDKLLALDSGKTTYPHEEYFKLLGYRVGDVGFDLLREDLNLPPKICTSNKLESDTRERI